MNDGNSIPSIGLGTFKHQNLQSMVQAIMKVGYSHLDTASIYKTEEVVGNALAECLKMGKKREEMFITTKLWHDGFHDVEASLVESLKKLKLE